MAALRGCFVLRNCIRRSFSSSATLDLSGIYPPIPTPFNADETIAYDKLQSNLKVWEQKPFKGYLVQGSNGEFKMLRDSERVELIQRARECVKTDKLLLAGSACESTVATIDMSNAMAEVGANAVLVINPSYYRASMTDSAIHKYFCSVADGSKVPVVVYNMPGNTGIDLSASLITKLAEHPNIIGLKDSGADVSKMAQIIHQTKHLDFQVLCGSAGLLLPALAVGAVGGINGFANVFGTELCQLVDLFHQGKMKEAAEIQRRLILPNAMITRQLGVPATKAVLDILPSMYGGPCRAPLLPLSSQERDSVLAAFTASGFL